MTRDEWLTELTSRQVTVNQLGTIMHVFYRLGFDIGSDYLEHAPGLDREERLNVTSWLINRDIDSMNNLTQGEAGRLIYLLKDVHAIDDLYSLLPDEYWEEDTEERKVPWKGILLVLAGIGLASL